MRMLVAYEFKKLLGRKALWVALILGLAFFLLNPMSNSDNSGSQDSVRGIKDIYRQYEGQVLTEALQAKMQQDFDGYIAAHPDRFTQGVLEGVDEDKDGQPDTTYFPNEVATDYDSEVWVAYSNLIGNMSLEDTQEFMRTVNEMLTSGTDTLGKPLTLSYRRSLEQTVQAGVAEPVVHYTKGWEGFFKDEPLPGLLVLVITSMALLGLFNGEASARLDSVVLCTKARRQMVWAKLFVGAAVPAGAVLLFFGLQLARMALLWGLDGAMLPITALESIRYATNTLDLSVLSAFALSAVVLALAAVACGAVVAWASAQFRHVLLTLLAGGAVLAGMVWLWKQDVALFGTESSLAVGANQLLYALPPNTLTNTYFMPERVASAGTLALLIILPIGLSVLLGWLANRAFLRRCKT
jgi:ABC-type transport system involved in multi-copper enzyme maturation permease subunit